MFDNLSLPHEIPDASSPELSAKDPAARKLADQMSSYWVNFARTGNPNGPGLPQWPSVKALKAGEVDVIQVFEPFPSLLLADKAGHVWYEAARRGPTSYTTFYTRRGTLLSRQQYLVDIEEWGLRDARLEQRVHMDQQDIADWTQAIPKEE